MKIVSSKDAKVEELREYKMTTGICNIQDDGEFEIGTVLFKPNSRIPAEGFGRHDFDEYAYVIKGSIDSQIGEERYNIEAGQFSFIPKGLKHWSQNNSKSDCEIVWFKVKSK